MVAYDVSDTGAKNYLVSTWTDILSIHRGGKALGFPHIARRFFYEGIFYGPVIPFFDLDGEAGENPGLLDELDDRTRFCMELISHSLRKIFDINVTASDFVVLDASNAKKASRHLLLRKKGVYFADLYQHARFTSVIRDQILKLQRRRTRSPRLLRYLTVHKTDKGMDKPLEKSLIDLTVYKSGLQLFRMYGCTKRGQDRPLRRAAMCTFPIPRDDHDALFLASFVGRVDDGDGTEPAPGLVVPDRFIGAEGIVCYGGEAVGKKRKKRSSRGKKAASPPPKRESKNRTVIDDQKDPRFVAVRDYLSSNEDTKPWLQKRFKIYFYQTSPSSGVYLVYPTSKACAIRQRMRGEAEHGKQGGNPFVCLYRSGKAILKCHSGICKENSPQDTVSLSHRHVLVLWPDY